jgi:hypothetical protein
MFQDITKRLSRNVRFNKIGRLVRRGIIPEGVEQAEIYEAIRHTHPAGVLELLGFLRVKVFRKRGYIWHCDDYGLVSCKKVTTAFANYLVASLITTNTAFANFRFHDMGDNSAAESNAGTALNNSRETRVAGNQQNNGAGVYQSIATITATAGYTVQEQGLFNVATGGTMMDRNLVPNAPVVINLDTVQFTYELSVSAEA